MKFYVYEEETKELTILEPSSYDSLKAILYNTSGKDNGYLIYPKPLNTNDMDDAKKKSDDFKFHCRHIYENGGNFLSFYKDVAV